MKIKVGNKQKTMSNQQYLLEKTLAELQRRQSTIAQRIATASKISNESRREAAMTSLKAEAIDLDKAIKQKEERRKQMPDNLKEEHDAAAKDNPLRRRFQQPGM